MLYLNKIPEGIVPRGPTEPNIVVFANASGYLCRYAFYKATKFALKEVFVMKRFCRTTAFFLILLTLVVAFALLGAVAGRAQLLNTMCF